MIESTPKFLNGVYTFQGSGYERPVPLHEDVQYVVPANRRAQPIYFRAGNGSNEMIFFVLMRDGKPMRYFPVGAKASEHVSLAVVEDINPDEKIEILIGAPAGLSGSVVLDLGLVEI